MLQFYWHLSISLFPSAPINSTQIPDCLLLGLFDIPDSSTLINPAIGLSFTEKGLTPSHWHCASDAEIIDNVLNAADKAKDTDNESREVNFLKSKKITWKKADSASDLLINF